jgi:surfeit locus 1 family protein
MRSLGRVAIALMWLTATVGLVALGTWQVQRRAWKLALIHRVEARLAAPSAPAPRAAGPDDAYTRVQASGRFLAGRDSFVQAVTDLGPGWWVLTPLRTPEATILVNRGFVARRVAATPPAGAVTVHGLLRWSEAGGGFLRSNAPAAERWYSRDVAAIAARRQLGPVAPYFIDADTTPARGPDQPVGGLTVVRFTNNHLAYAITWYVLALMSAAGLVYWWVADRRAILEAR